ncbi:MAG: response regulator transcription factor [Clostridia bacterium]|nr:response regulator transcription factor [Clostridia bacterium]
MNILIVEDEFSLADAVSAALKKEGFSSTIKTDGEEGEYGALTGSYDLILLDVMLPKKDGFEILHSIKEEKIKTPVIMLTAKSAMTDKLAGLENGADDYITKPFSIRELLARVKIVLKRNNNIEDTASLSFGDITLDTKTAKLTCGENEVKISGKEMNLLEYLLINQNQISARETLAERIWGFDSEAEYNNVEVYVTFLRRKLGLIGSNVKIKAVRGLGYRLES